MSYLSDSALLNDYPSRLILHKVHTPEKLSGASKSQKINDLESGKKNEAKPTIAVVALQG